MPSVHRVFRVALIVFLVWHLGVVLVAPNSSLERLRSQNSWFTRYIRTFGFGPYWSFFAPEPGPPPVHIEWEVLDGGGAVVQTGVFPEPEPNYFFRDRFNRRLAFVNLILMDRSKVDQAMSRYVCERFPEADSVRLFRSVDPVPSLTDVASGKKALGDPKDRIREWTAHSYCKKA